MPSCGTSCPATMPCPRRPGRHSMNTSRPTPPRPTTPRASTGGATGPSSWSASSRAGSATMPRPENDSGYGCCPSATRAWTIRPCSCSTACIRARSRAA
jgi:hypothetical protein